MKRFSVSIITLGLATMFMSSVSFAGINYTRYQQDFLMQKGMQKAPAEEKGFEHKSKYQREQQEGTAAPQATPQKEGTTPKPASKYDRRNWNPTQE
jgi:hypothetical protein